jgi:hypothetical protein
MICDEEPAKEHIGDTVTAWEWGGGEGGGKGLATFPLFLRDYKNSIYKPLPCIYDELSETVLS